ncbi:MULTISPECIES: LysE family translocator [Pseudomonas]|uniref:LysE family translocator n=1 Tax=Pseudomonas TaxID=286 RepID=UPI00081278FB|nr:MULTISPECIES: LysE family translocator [unclassified Pseudomonas]MBW8126516.1 LysE family translocator [Pseudomonas sp. LAP_36]MBW8135463.1 LysE family translocator [Pseudomonas sp. PAMC 26818]CRM17337.1 Homoserine/homoserine lactone efflux protein [Pseudomonas sp. 58 R 12]CRM56258.1 Homoserine/homoserine lactone efflux protein [Pseudomonas sp. 24 E 1]CRM77411.1 Homoserine/homoserine lactone efflux protein [Pseudomonas sp. 52 E 6]
MTSALTLSSFLYFLLFCATMTFSPGPMTLLLLSLGLRDGLRRSIPAQIGASVSYLISILIFAVGFSELIKGNLAITQGIQIVGVAYILYLAYKQWTSSGPSIDRVGAVEGSRSLFGKGLLTGFSNPKTLIMFSAVFPQFAGTGGQGSTVDIAILGMTFLVLQFASGCLYCYFGQRIKHVLENPKRRVVLQRVTAVLLLGVALMLARGFSH